MNALDSKAAVQPELPFAADRQCEYTALLHGA